MAESIEKQDDYELPLEEVANNLADPLMHAHHHEMCLKDRERFDDDLEQLRDADLELLKRIEELERTVNTLAPMLSVGQGAVPDVESEAGF